MLFRSQITITPGGTATSIINTFVSNGIVVTNPIINCGSTSYGSYTGNLQAGGIGLSNGGIILTTGSAVGADGPNNSTLFGLEVLGYDYADLQLTSQPGAGTPPPSFDNCRVEFDMTPICSSFNIAFVFGSEEYPEYVTGAYNDGFGIFVSGPNPLGGNYTSYNMARLPNGQLVSIDNVNSNLNNSYYNTNNTEVMQYDGYTDGLTAQLAVIPCSTYHIKIIIADAGDQLWDSGIFLGAGSFACSMPALSITASPTTICAGASTTLTASTAATGGTYLWSPGGATTQSITVNPSTTTTYTCSYTFSSCSVITATTTVTVATITPSFQPIGPYCSGATIPVFSTSSTNGISGTWSPAINNTATTTYTFTPTSGQCATTTTRIITVTPNVTPTFAAVAAICSGATAPVLPTSSTNTPAITGTWSPAVSNTATTTYTFTPTAGQCATTTTRSITVTPTLTPSVSIVASASACTGVAITFTATPTNGGSAPTYQWKLNGTNVGTGLASYTNSSLSNTAIVTVVLTANNTCQTAATATAAITTAPSAAISYTSSPFCKTLTTAQAVSQTGTLGGTYSSTTGLSINASTGAITPSLSTAGTYTVTYTIAASGGCAAAVATASVTITTAPSASISFAGSPFCRTLTSAQSVTRTGTTGGTYSSTTGLSINASTGAITPSASTAGTYIVVYTIAASGGCAAISTTTTVTITTSAAATISYTSSPWCKTITTSRTVTRTGTSGGTYSAIPAGLMISSMSGSIIPSSSAPGTYTVIYTLAASGGCAAVIATATVTITAAPTATIGYINSPFCRTVTTGQYVNQTGTTGGVYSASPSGLSINTNTGAITPSTSTAGTYTVSHTLAASGGCAAVSTTASVTITAAPGAVISYLGSPFCKTLTTGQVVSQTGTTGGTYSSITGLSLNASTGAITPSTSTAGTYTVVYTIAAAGGCASVSTTTTVTITTAPTASISYTASPWCKTITTARTVTRTGSSLGTYSALPSGLMISSMSGSIIPSSSAPGTYTVRYTLAATGGCAAVIATATVTITAAPTATIGYINSPFCNTLTSAQSVSQTGTTGGVYSASPSGLSINTSTGAITPSTSIAGTYTVSYTIAASGGCAAVIKTTSVVITNCLGIIVNNTISEHISPVEIEELALEGSSATLINQAIPMWKVLFDRNPFESTFKLSIENVLSTKLEVQILNSAGLLLSTRYVAIDDLGEAQFGEDLKPGVYFVLVKQRNNRQTLRMIKNY